MLSNFSGLQNLKIEQLYRFEGTLYRFYATYPCACHGVRNISFTKKLCVHDK